MSQRIVSTRFSFRPLLVVVALWSTICGAAEKRAAGSGATVCLYCSFDGSAEATYAAGPGYATSRQCRFVPGREGKGLALKRPGVPVVYVERGNLDKRRGSIEFWLRPDWNGADPGNRALVWEPGPSKPGGQVIWLWKYGQSLRFDVRDPGDHYLTASIAKWKAGEWHHILATWDCEHGTRLYLDGRPAASRDFTWTPRARGRFQLGCRTGGDDPAGAVMDELRMYTAALAPAAAARAFAGTLVRRRAKPVVSAGGTTVASTGKRKPKLLFAASFDAGTPVPEHAAGEGQPLEARGLTFGPGVRGRAVRFPAASVLRYAEPGNLDKARGTLMFWFRPDWSGAESKRADGREIWRCLFREGPPPEKRHGSNQLWIWLWGDRLRVDMSDALDRYIVRPITDWNRGEWHHIALTWDNRVFRRLYLDGELVRGGRDSRNPFLPVAWDLRTFPWFALGGNGAGNPAEGSIDELKIYDGPLEAKAVLREYARVFPLTVEMPHRYCRVGKTERLRWSLTNRNDELLRGRLTLEVVGSDGTALFPASTRELRLEPGVRRDISRIVQFSTPGGCECRFAWKPAAGAGQKMERRIVVWAVAPEPAASVGKDLDLETVADIDCAATLPKERLLAVGEMRVLDTSAGRYREAGPNRHDRFALRVTLPAANALYAIDWDYPDDKPRTMEVVAQPVANGQYAYELGTGICCGAEYPLSDTMRTARLLYWARDRDMAIIFMTCEKERPAAAGRIRIRRVVGRLPKLPVQAAAPVDGWSRLVGLYYEDPAMCYDFGGYTSMPGFAKTVSRLMDYLDWFGQNLFLYPAVWYQGPFYPSRSQGVAMSRPHPPNFIEYMLLQFSERGLSFIPTWNLHNLPAAAGDFVWRDDMLLTGEAAASPLMVCWDGAPNLGGWHGSPPNYNPLAPSVRRAILTMVDEMLDLYADYPAFKGICFHLTRHAMLWFGDLDAGYNDCCVEAFEKATGIRIPVAATSPGRANQRYRWLMDHAREEWMAWRCRALHDLYAEIAAKLTARRADLRLILNTYRPTKQEIMGIDRERYAKPDYALEIWREAGLDPRLYVNDANIVVQRTIYPADYRWNRVHRRPVADPLNVRRLNYDARHYAGLAGLGTAWINMHDRYWEDAVGRNQRWKEFWGQEIAWRVSTLNACPPYCLESYLIPLAKHDFMGFTKGGFLVGTLGMEQSVGRFSQVFRALPARPFATLAGMPAPVVGRSLVEPDGTWFYLVNPGTKAVKTSLRFSGTVKSQRNLRSGISEPVAAGIRTFSLDPMSMVAYFLSGADVRVAGAGTRRSTLQHH